ncbi:MAG TPA: hypothetical protein VF353_02860 [Candidatus Binatia bacterium]
MSFAFYLKLFSNEIELMKKLTSLFFAIAMLFSVAFVGDSISSSTSTGNPFAAQAQVTVKKKRKPGAIRRVYRGGKWVGSQVWTGTKWVSKKTWEGMKWTYKGGRKVVSRSKKIIY